MDYGWESGRIKGLAGQTLLTHWDQWWDCFHWKEFQEWTRRAISDFTQRSLTTVLIHSQAHMLSHTFEDTVSHANNGVRDTLCPPVSLGTQLPLKVLISPFAERMLSPLTTDGLVSEFIYSVKHYFLTRDEMIKTFSKVISNRRTYS